MRLSTLPLLRHLATAALLSTVIATGAMAQDKTKLTVVLGYVPNVESYGPIYAKAKGFFDEAGLDVTLVPGGNGVDSLQMIDSGLAQISIGGSDAVIAAVDKGVALKVFAAEFQFSPVAMTCREDSGVTEPSMLKGKRLGIKQAAQLYAETFLSKNGLTMADITPTTIGGSDVSTIIAGKVDCMITTFAFNEPRLIANAGVPVKVLRLGDYGLNSQPDAYAVTQAFYDTPGNKEILAKYLTAEAKAWDELFKDPAAGAKFIVEGGFNDGLDIDQQTFQAEQQVTYMVSALTKEKGIMWLDPKTWAENAANALAAGSTTKLVDPASFLTTEILEASTLPKY
ncbi:ABC transporter substrate-binding protein [Devosia sp.]|uniref:ABC transporter substrate-binding protein n=1 Tax=Devosia sp. TaxID=1871048 RepID=UPI003BABBAA7